MATIDGLVAGLELLLGVLKSFESGLQERPRDSLTLQENQLLLHRSTLPPLPDSFLRQIEALFSNERSKCIYFVLHELEGICGQLRAEVWPLLWPLLWPHIDAVTDVYCP